MCLSVPDLFRERPQNLVAQFSTAAKFLCETDFTTSPRNILWSRSDGIEDFEEIAIDGYATPGVKERYSVEYELNTRERTSRSLLTITNVQPGDAGTYKCHIVTGSSYAQLIVTGRFCNKTQ